MDRNWPAFWKNSRGRNKASTAMFLWGLLNLQMLGMCLESTRTFPVLQQSWLILLFCRNPVLLTYYLVLDPSLKTMWLLFFERVYPVLSFIILMTRELLFKEEQSFWQIIVMLHNLTKISVRQSMLLIFHVCKTSLLNPLKHNDFSSSLKDQYRKVEWIQYVFLSFKVNFVCKFAGSFFCNMLPGND